MSHIPVLANEIMKFLQPQSGKNYIDCTVGDGGHAELVLSLSNPNGMMLAIDRDQGSVDRARKNLQRFGDRVIFVHDTYAHLSQIISYYNFSHIYGILFDLGVSSYHFEESGAGFSFRGAEVLDMRFDRTLPTETAADILNQATGDQLTEIFRTFGEEKDADALAQEIIVQRKKKHIETAADLVTIIVAVKKYSSSKIHPATKIFQALRIAVNKELEQLEGGLPQAVGALELHGKLAVISYHSLEEKIIKRFFQEQTHKGIIKILTEKPISPTATEQRENPRSRSAKLHVAEKIV